MVFYNRLRARTTLLTRGYVLVVTLMVISALFFFVINFTNFLRSQHSLTLAREHQLKATLASEAGLYAALSRLQRTPEWRGSFSNTKLPHSQATYSLTFNKRNTKVPLSVDNTQGLTAILAPDKSRLIPAGTIYLVSTGKSGPISRQTHAIVVPGRILYQDDFTNRSALKSWHLLQGKYLRVNHGYLKIGSTGSRHPHLAVTGKPSWKNYTLTLTAEGETNRQGGGIGLYFCLSRTGSKVKSGYLLQYDSNTHRLSLFLIRGHHKQLVAWQSILKGKRDHDHTRKFKWNRFTPQANRREHKEAKKDDDEHPHDDDRKPSFENEEHRPDWLLKKHTFKIRITPKTLSVSVDKQNIFHVHPSIHRGMIGLYTYPRTLWSIDTLQVKQDTGIDIISRW